MGASEVEETGLSGTVEELRVLATHVEQASQLFKLDHVRAAVIVDGLAELHVRWPAVPIVFCERAGSPRNGRTATSPPPRPGLSPNILPCNISHPATRSSGVPAVPEPGTGEVRACARGIGLAVPNRGRVGPEVRQAWRDAHRIT
jgi:hypothetical protein